MNQPPKNWKLVLKTTSMNEVHVVKAMLADNDITAEEINTHDQMFEPLNANRELGLFVHESDLELAMVLIKSIK